MAAASKSCLLDDRDDDILIVEPCCTKARNPSTSKLNMKRSIGKRPAQWVDSSFDAFGDLGNSQQSMKAKETKSESKLPKLSSQPRAYGKSYSNLKDKVMGGKVSKSNNAESLWSDKYTPESRSELAVHAKKITEVEMWFKTFQKNQGRICPFLLLTGPAGCGKTATVKVLCKELDFDIQEWSNPVNSGNEGREREKWSTESYKSSDFVMQDSQLKIFQDFVLRANKYQRLNIFGGAGSHGKIILIEDFPNIFYKNPQSFHDVLRNYKLHGKCPLVFIVSDSASGQSNERLLFPPDIQSELNVSNIAFNPVALTLLTKLLTRIANTEAINPAHRSTFSKPSPAIIESIALCCSGDIRGAVNSLQFASLKGQGEIIKTKPAAPRGTSKKGKGKSDNKVVDKSALGNRDASMFLFRALGKILYAKRDVPEDVSVSTSPLPSHLRHHERPVLQVDAEDVIDKCHISGDFFNAYLHQNYLEFCSDIDDIDRASEYFSDSDFITSNGFNKKVLETYSSCVAARGLMHSNKTGPISGTSRGWKPLHKPQHYGTIRKARSTLETGKSMFRAHWWTPDMLFTELLPYVSIINITLHNTRQIRFLQEVCRFSGLSGPEKLDDKEGAEIQDAEEASSERSISVVSSTDVQNEDSCDAFTLSQTKVKSAEQDEEIEIEDFDFD